LDSKALALGVFWSPKPLYLSQDDRAIKTPHNPSIHSPDPLYYRQKNRVAQLRAGTLNLQGFGNFVLERSTLKVF
jgi:hypothetical protein